VNQEPPLKGEIVNPEVSADVPYKADVPFLSFNRTGAAMLGIGSLIFICVNNIYWYWRTKSAQAEIKSVKSELERDLRNS
jgi:hypothetical protein